MLKVSQWKCWWEDQNRLGFCQKEIPKMTLKWFSLVQLLCQKVKNHLENIFHILIFLPLNVEGVGRGRSLSSQREKLPTLAQVHREISDKSAELLGRRAMDVGQLVDWIADKRGQSAFTNRASPTSRVQASCAAFTWNMTRRSPLPAGTLTGNHPRGVSADCDHLTQLLHFEWSDDSRAPWQ